MTTYDTSKTSPNYDSRPVSVKAPFALLIHTGEGTRQSDLAWLCHPASRVSSHYYVCRDGHIYQLVPDHLRAWHAGKSSYAGISDWNSASIGIETEHQAGQDWPGVQVAALRSLCLDLIARYDIRQEHIAAHRWVAPGRKLDPSDWSDPDLHAWIASLYTAVDYAALWGPQIAYVETWAIPAAWRPRARELGQAVTGEQYRDHWSIQLFEHGLAIYCKATGKARVWTYAELWRINQA